MNAMTTAPRIRRRQAGISLVEALVALAVMAFGTLSVLGVQGSLRLNADIARQRGEALRIAQERIEALRELNTLAAFAALDDDGPQDVTGPVGDTVYTVTRTVRDAPAAVDADGVELPLERARYKGVTLAVAWTDRTGAAQSVALATTVHGAIPLLGATLSVPGDTSAIARPGGRHRGVPPEAVNQGDGTSVLAPPGAPDGVRWTFDNATGVITRLCDTCEPVQALLLTGYVRFALTPAAPAPADAEVPPSSAFPVAVQVAQTAPDNAPEPGCYARTTLSFVQYFCAVQTVDDSGWSGRATLIEDTQLPLSASSEPDRFRVCRYTRLVGSPPVPSTRNVDHPDRYTGVTQSLFDQNFLVIRAGDGTEAFGCPGDDDTTPLVNGQTWLHQP